MYRDQSTNRWLRLPKPSVYEILYISLFMKLTPQTSLSLKLTLSALSLCFLISCGESKTDTNALPAENPAPPVSADSVDFATLPSDSSTHLITGFPRNLETATLNGTDQHLIDSLMEALVAEYNSKLASEKSKPADSTALAPSPIDLKYYKKQYIVVLNAKGEKEVWANCFCKAIEKRIEFVDWKKTPVKVIDGGNCFFNVKLNLAQRKAYDLKVNSGG